MSNLAVNLLVGVASSIAAAIVLAFFANRRSLRFSFRRLLRDVLELRRLLDADDYKPDLLVGIDRNGAIVASILAGHLGLRSILASETRTTRAANGARVVSLSVTHQPPEGSLAGTKILLVACFIDTGRTAEVVYQYYKQRADQPTDVRLAALYMTPAPVLKPRYCKYVVGKNLKISIDRLMHKMPWMSKDWKFSFPDER